MLKKLIDIICITVALSGALSAFSPIAFSQQDEDKSFLLMYFKEEELVVESPTRGSKLLTQAAENITVVTAEEIKLMNAHTVADALNAVTGVQVLMSGGPGSSALASIQGSENRHVSVFMDGIPLNNLGDNVTELGSIPVQNIDKIEIIKGPASSAWGSGLGGVINIITKNGKRDGTSGTVSASYGKNNTGDFRVEISRKQDNLESYFSAGRLQTDGFRPHTDFSGNNAYAKLTYHITKDTSAFLSVGYERLSRGAVEVPAQDLFIDNKLETVRTSLGVNVTLSEKNTLNLSVRQRHQTFAFFNNQVSTGQEFSQDNFQDNGYGSSAKFTHKDGVHNIVFGADYDSHTLKSNRITDNEQDLTKWASFVNDTLSFDHLSITPGIRYDDTSTNGNFTSPSLGMTYRAADTTLLRAYAARGFSIPPFAATFGDNQFIAANPGLKVERVQSYQVGAENTTLKHLWLKLSAFRHDIRDAIVVEQLTGNSFIGVNRGKARREGMELEVKTAPVYHTSLSAGAAFIEARDLDTGQKISGVPQKTYDAGLQFDDEKSFKALLIGHYIFWNTDPFFEGKYDSFVFDLHLVKNIYIRNEQRLEAFIDVHNLFDDPQYPALLYKNPERWVEAGLRHVF